MLNAGTIRTLTNSRIPITTHILHQPILVVNSTGGRVMKEIATAVVDDTHTVQNK